MLTGMRRYGGPEYVEMFTGEYQLERNTGQRHRHDDLDSHKK